MVLSEHGKITVLGLPDYLVERQSLPEEHISEKKEIESALKETNGNKAKAARLLGMSRSTFYEKLNKTRNTGGSDL